MEEQVTVQISAEAEHLGVVQVCTPLFEARFNVGEQKAVASSDYEKHLKGVVLDGVTVFELVA